MVKITTAKRIIKRVLLSNIATSKKDLYLTPLISGRHGIGKSMLVRELAAEMNATYITIEGGSLKEGEITGLPYQYVDGEGHISFRFLPYYVIARIQQKEKEIFLQSKRESDNDAIEGEENRYSINDLTPEEKIKLLQEKKISPVIIFFDEINRTDSQVYKELMNILLTRSVNGYQLPWWVFIIGAMNPASSDSVYATNEMDPAQLDRFIKINVKANSVDWLNYAKNSNLSPIIFSYIKNNRADLIGNEKGLDDDIESTPSPRGYDMIDTIIQAMPLISVFFSHEELTAKTVQSDLKEIFCSKLGSEVGERFYEHFLETYSRVEFSDFINDDEKLTATKAKIQGLSIAQKTKLFEDLFGYMRDFSGTLSHNWSMLSQLEKKIAVLLRCFEHSTAFDFAKSFEKQITRSGVSFKVTYHDIFFDLVAPILTETKKIGDTYF